MDGQHSHDGLPGRCDHAGPGEREDRGDVRSKHDRRKGLRNECVWAQLEGREELQTCEAFKGHRGDGSVNSAPPSPSRGRRRPSSEWTYRIGSTDGVPIRGERRFRGSDLRAFGWQTRRGEAHY